ncbi:unnamed protein product [Rotaria sp. Silwood2]|nr:unnamed protein product [Rotaria sp. Silwood2]CAF4627792.1 unnamed protein product [Rotaria sp. Silwood2]
MDIVPDAVTGDDRLHSEEYLTQFNTDNYLCMYAFFEFVPLFDFIIEKLVRIFVENKSRLGHDRALEFGAGPSLLASFVLAQQVKSIRFSDYTPSNLAAVADWIKEDPGAHDWSDLFNHILQEYQRQANCGSQSVKRSDWEKQLREALKLGGLSTCDVNAVDCPVLGGEPNQYDIVLSSMCLEVACVTHHLFKATVKRLYALLKADGLLILIHGRNQTYHILNDRRFFVLPVNEITVSEALQEAGFVDIHIESRDQEADAVADGDGIMVINAFKPKISA